MEQGAGHVLARGVGRSQFRFRFLIPYSGIRRRGMQALIRRGAAVELADVAPPRGDCVVDVAFAGVCRTDLAVADGRIAVAEGRVLGHELSGYYEGRPVSVIPFVDRAWLGIDVDGAFASQVAVPRACLVALPDGMSMVHGAYVEPVAAALGVLEVVRAGMRVAIGGDNRIAALTARIVEAAGARRVDARADVAIEHDGAVDLTRLVDGGVLILKSRAARDVLVPAGELVARSLTIRGISHGSFLTAVAWLHERRIAIDDLLAAPRPLTDFAAVFAASERQKQLFAL